MIEHITSFSAPEFRYKKAKKNLNLRALLREAGIRFIDEGVELRFSCINPKHPDRNPSMTINCDNSLNKFGVYSCFGCGKAGSLIGFVQEIFKLDTPDEAVKFIVNFSRGEFEKGIIERYENKEIKENFKEIKLPAEFQYILLDCNSTYEKYLLGRGLSRQWIKDYGWGFCARGKYAKRVILPLYKEMTLVGWYGRHISTNVMTRKVRNSYGACFEKIIFPFNQIDWNLKYIWVTESVFNLFSLKKLGIKNVICFFGNKLSDWKAHVLEQFPLINIIPDGDDGGKELVARIYQKLHGTCKIQAVDFPEGEDANSISLKELEKVVGELSEEAARLKIKTKYE